MTDISPLVDVLKQEEGLRLCAYDDATGATILPGTRVAGNPTIGIGTNLAPGAGITEVEADYLLINRLRSAAGDAATLACFNRLDDVRRLALIDMVFNMGLGKVKTFTTFLGLLAAGNYAAAGQDLLGTLWARQVGQRAQRIATIIQNGVWR